ncbi:MAG: UDP-glucose 4-epimerase GalE [Spirochaetes bacterium GWD1_61_31]|nr:MAG: UDP-glucose 4-epimerase GalE [Spirochaetes bacterium GWB1_60_80]OHD30817.1 MAG: UDP-glucose 4-epimerase GalE [Spirochaetes bacterium GWC1_61_12]OHD36392.1 MAG: UDP-glucose 4-epimerase GalE [Spirochaetes bacterium GWD1_61_31]OHD46317.1 MAG: UDP-glucose 4-epimerase GalE [Spirochaetes bacterium GWE1_60_18]OHD60924.1 MAG: UDP-glucose 4-epimerase GalE [Spirochaetes bacterium GWF1_60_12]HAP42818.1 UDP-glucose 4-epimerase GalE [Spirochaetaceae bacterium]
MKVLILGGAGYIGSHVCLEMMAAGHSVTVFDNLSSGTRDNLFPGADFIEGDIMRPSDLAAALAPGFDAAVHLAAFKAAGESMLVPEKYATNNIAGTINVLNAMTAAGLKYLVFSSSAAVYGEPAYLPIDEQHPKQPTNFYGFTKLQIEGLLGWYDQLRGLRSVALRYFNAAGYDPAGRVRGLERNPANLLPIIMEVAAGLRPELQIYGDDYDTPDGTCLRDYVHVSDLARAHVLALEKLAGGLPSQAFNLGSESGLSVKEILAAARRLTGQAVPARVVARRPGDPAKLVAGSSLAKQLLGWQPVHSDLDSLVRSSWRVYQGKPART